MSQRNGSDATRHEQGAAGPVRGTTRIPLPRGLAVISGVFALATFGSVLLLLFGDKPARILGAVSAPIFLLAAIGVAARINWVRVAVINFLVAAACSQALLVLLPWFDPTVRPSAVVPTAVLIGLTFWMLSYLMRRDVREMFEKS